MDSQYDESPECKDSPYKKSMSADKFKFEEKLSVNSSGQIEISKDKSQGQLQLALSADAIPDTQRKDYNENMNETLRINDLI